MLPFTSTASPSRTAAATSGANSAEVVGVRGATPGGSASTRWRISGPQAKTTSAASCTGPASARCSSAAKSPSSPIWPSTGDAPRRGRRRSSARAARTEGGWPLKLSSTTVAVPPSGVRTRSSAPRPCIARTSRRRGATAAGSAPSAATAAKAHTAFADEVRAGGAQAELDGAAGNVGRNRAALGVRRNGRDPRVAAFADRQHARRASRPAQRRQVRQVGRQHEDAIRLQPLGDRRLFRRDRVQAAEVADMRRADGRDHRHVRPRQARQGRDLARVVHADLDHGETAPRGQRARVNGTPQWLL